MIQVYKIREDYYMVTLYVVDMTSHDIHVLFLVLVRNVKATNYKVHDFRYP